ncbi:restriction endonuclease subunit S [Bacillus pseudomycoides]|uniref:restriction endonuclease subunit S n=1 Tax=Bacillus pseudomycoides TaxID=64104 RepID=UPI002FFD9085
MSDKITKSPQIRFAGFTDAWDQRKAKKLFNPIVEKGYEKLPVLSVTQEFGVVYREEVGIDIKYDPSTLKNYKVIHPGDFVISLRSFQGGFELSDKLGITSPAYTIFKPIETKEHDNLFWKTKFKTFKFIESLKTVTFGIRDGKSISFSEFGDLTLYFPSNKDEQVKIGQFISSLDHLITLHQRKLELLKETKKSLLQKMFPKDGANVPEIRFEGFTDAWKQRKLGKFVQDYVEKTTVQNQYPVLTSSQKRGIIHQEEYFADRQVTTQNNIGYFVIPRGYFTFRSRSDNGVFKFNRNDLIDKGIISYFYPVFKIVNGNSDFFLNMLNSTIKKQVSLEAEGTGQRVLSLKKFKNINVVIPGIQEQIKIGNFFKQLDDTITLHQRELNSLKNLKKSLLQQMFV